MSSQAPPQGGVREGGADEAMECERWGEDEEVGMDIDLSVEEESHLLSEISQARTTLTINSPASLQPQASTSSASYAVRHAQLQNYVTVLGNLATNFFCNFCCPLKLWIFQGVTLAKLVDLTLDRSSPVTALSPLGNTVFGAGHQCPPLSLEFPGGAKGFCHQRCWEASAHHPLGCHARTRCPQG